LKKTGGHKNSPTKGGNKKKTTSGKSLLGGKTPWGETSGERTQNIKGGSLEATRGKIKEKKTTCSKKKINQDRTNVGNRWGGKTKRLWTTKTW